jgi:hypothetical protein
MTNLLKKLRPEILHLLNEDLIEYPNSTKILINELTSTYYINDLKYFAILDIQSLYWRAFNKRTNVAWDCLIENYNDL